MPECFTGHIKFIHCLNNHKHDHHYLKSSPDNWSLSIIIFRIIIRIIKPQKYFDCPALCRWSLFRADWALPTSQPPFENERAPFLFLLYIFLGSPTLFEVSHPLKGSFSSSSCSYFRGLYIKLSLLITFVFGGIINVANFVFGQNAYC